MGQKGIIENLGLDGVLPSTLKDEGFENTPSEKYEVEEKNEVEKEIEVEKIRYPNEINFGEDDNHLKWISHFVDNVKKCRRLCKKDIICLEKSFAFKILWDEIESKFTTNKRTFNLMEHLFKNDLKNYNTTKNCEVCLMNVILRGHEVSSFHKIDFEISINTKSQLLNNIVHKKTVHHTDFFKTEIETIFCAETGIGRNVGESMIRCGFGKEPILNFIKIDEKYKKKGRKKKEKEKKNNDIFENHGNKKIHKTSFIALWLLKNKYTDWDNEKIVTLYLAPKNERGRKKRKVECQLDNNKTIIESESKKIVDDKNITIEGSALKSLKTEIGKFFKNIPYVDSIIIRIKNVVSEEKEKEKIKEQTKKGGKTLGTFKFHCRLEFLVRDSKKEIDFREYPRNIY